MPTPRSSFSVLGMLALVSVMTSCGGGGGNSASAPTPAPQTWTIFIYASADNNLTYSLAADISEMNQAALGSHVHVVVAADWDSSHAVRTAGSGGGPAPWEPTTGGSPYPTGTQWYRIRGNGLAPTLVTAGVEANFDTESYLETATTQAFQSYPAQRYAMILWDHGGSWQGGFGGDTQNGTIAGTGMSAESVGSAISNAVITCGLTGSRPLECIAFDTCLMACPEVIEPLKDLAKTYIACAEIDFGAGWDYTATLSAISSQSWAPATTIAAQEVAHWNAHHAVSGSDLFAKSHVALDLSRWDAFATSMDSLVAALITSPSMTTLEWGLRQFATAPGYSFDSSLLRAQPNLRDVGQLVAKLSTVSSDATVAARAADALTRLTSMRIGLAQGAYRSANGQSGLHIECAQAKTYTDNPGRLTAYGTLAAAWNAVSSWSTLLTVVESMDDVTPPVIAQSSTGGANVTVDFSTSDIDIGEVAIWLTRTNPDTTIDDFGLVGVDSIGPGAYQLDWDLTLPVVDDGVTASFARIDRVVIGDGINASLFGIPCRYDIDGWLLDGYLLVGATDVTTALFLQRLDSGGVAVLPLFPGGQITPLIDRYAGGPTPAPQDMTTLTIPTDGQLGVSRMSSPAGSYRLLVTGMDVWGNEAGVFTVPYAVTQR